MTYDTHIGDESIHNRNIHNRPIRPGAEGPFIGPVLRFSSPYGLTEDWCWSAAYGGKGYGQDEYQQDNYAKSRNHAITFLLLSH